MVLRTSALALLLSTASTAVAAPGGLGGLGGLGSFGDRVSDAGTDAGCIAGLSFDGHCITTANAQDALGFSSGTVLDVFACEDEDGDRVEDCLMVQVDEGDYPSGYVDYLVEAAPCTGGLLASEMCLGDYTTPYRAVHDVTEWSHVHELFRTDVITHQVVETMRFSPRWVDETITTVETDATGTPHSARGVEYSITFTHESLDGEVIDEETLHGNILASGDVHGTSVETLCSTLKSGRSEVGDMVGAGTKALCTILWPLSSVEVAGFKLARDTSLCGNIGNAVNKSIQWGGSDNYNSCIQNPGAWFPWNFANTGMLAPDGTLSTSIPIDSQEEETCDEMDGKEVRIAYERGDGEGGTETCTVWAQLDCTGSGDECACTGNPIEDPICE